MGAVAPMVTSNARAPWWPAAWRGANDPTPSPRALINLSCAQRQLRLMIQIPFFWIISHEI